MATDKAILDQLSIYLGEDILMWLGQVITRRPNNNGQFWHIDQINWQVDGIHASIAITDMTLENGCLQVIPKTHLYDLSQAEIEARAKLANLNLQDGEAMVALADQLHPENAPHELVSLEIKAGQSFLMKGGLWHGVPGNKTDQLRIAMVARYMRPDVIGTDGECPLPCVLVAGRDTEQLNRLCHSPRSWFKEDFFLNYQFNKLLGTLSTLVNSGS